MSFNLTFKTRNNLYRAQAVGDGYVRISGHPEYCPEPIMAIMKSRVRVGMPVRFVLAEGPIQGAMINTSPVAEILEV